MPFEFSYDRVSQTIGYTMTYDPETVQQLQQIPESLRTFDSIRQCWVIPISKLLELQQFIQIPVSIEMEYQSYLHGEELKKSGDHFRIEVSASYSKLIPLYKFDFDLTPLIETCQFEPTNAKYTTAYKDGDWDGKYQLFNPETLQFPTGLLPNILGLLDLDFYSYSIVYKYPAISLHQYKWELQNVEFRDFQWDGIKLAEANQRGIFQWATGSGKTLLASGIIQNFGLKTLFLVHTKDLLYQAYNTFRSVFKNQKIGLIGDGHCELQLITVGTIQTISPKIGNSEDLFGDWNYDIEQEYDEEDIEVIRTEKITNIDAYTIQQYLESVQLVFFDETHHVPSKTFYKVAMQLKTPYRFGLSATPQRDDNFGLKIQAGIGKIIQNVSSSMLIEKGFLVSPHIKFIQVPPKSYPRQSNYAHVYKDYIVDNGFRNDIIRSIALKEKMNGHSILILVKQIRHLKCLSQMIEGAQSMDGSMKSEDRNRILSEFKQKQFQILIATTLADEGLDVSILDCLILAGSGRSSTKAIQRIGRVIRLGDQCHNPNCRSTDIRIKNIDEPCVCKTCGMVFKYHGKTSALVYDFLDQAKWMNDHSLMRKRVYQNEEKFVITIHHTKNVQS